jgi:multiple sugar transport system permease protein
MKNIFKKYQHLIYFLPAVAIFAVVILYPLINAFYVSFHQWDLATGGKMFFIGWRNYQETIQDSYFWTAIGRSLLFVLIVVPIEILLGTFIANLLNKEIRGQRFFRVIFILPMMITSIVVAILWKIIYDAQFGILNWALSVVGVSPQVWLGNPKLALLAVAVLDVWQNTPFIILIVLAALQSIPGEVYQAALIDGASRWQTFRYITLPYLKYTLLLGAVFKVVDTFRVFDTIYVLTKGGPGRATELISVYAYKTGFSLFKLCLSASQSFMLMILTLIIAAPLIVGILKTLQLRKGEN